MRAVLAFSSGSGRDSPPAMLFGAFADFAGATAGARAGLELGLRSVATFEVEHAFFNEFKV